MKKLLAIIISVSLLLSCCAISGFAADVATAVWDGTTLAEPKDSNSDGVKEIGTAAEFAWLGANGGSGSYILTNDIYLNDMAVVISEDTASLTTLDGTPITDTTTLNEWSAKANFSGVLDGDGYTVNGLFSDTTVAVESSSRHGMFLSTNNSTIKNLRLSNTWFEGATYQGTFAAYNNGGVATVNNCYVENVYLKSNPDEITNSLYPSSGAVVGYINGSSLNISNVAVNNILLVAKDREGAFVGDAWASGDISVSNSYNSTAYPTFGGASGANNYKGTITSFAVYSVISNSGSAAPSVITVAAADTIGKAPVLTMRELGEGFYTTASYPVQRIFLDEIDPAVNIQLGGDGTQGITFSATEIYRTEEALAAFPLTWEATIKAATDADDRLGVVMGNYSGSSISAGLELRDGGHPSIWIQTASGYDSKYKHNFDQIDVRTGKKMHLAITIDFSAKIATCYINGEAKQTITLNVTEAPAITNVMCIGGDLRSNNEQYLKQTEIYDVAVYSDVRTAQEIASDADAMDKADEDFLAGYDFTASGKAILTDLSVNNNHLTYSGTKVFETGTTFTTADKYDTSAVPSAQPLTFEIDLHVAPNASNSRLFTIIGNYKSYNSSSTDGECINLEIYTNSAPSLCLQKAGSVPSRYTFTDIDLRKEGRAHLAITIDYETNKLYCYINGVLRQTIASNSALPAPEMARALSIGRDQRPEGGSNLVSTEIFSVSAYSDTRTAAEIDAAMKGVDTEDSALLFAFDMSSDSSDLLDDMSSNGNDLVYTGPNPPAGQGITIDTTNYYKMSEVLSAFPKTVEAEVKVSTAIADDQRIGTLTGNYSSGSAKGVYNLEIYSGGKPRLYLMLPETGTVIDCIFDNVDIRTGNWIKLAIVYDETASTVTCYVNGEAKQTKSVSKFTPYAPSSELMVGVDMREFSGYKFLGRIRALNFFSNTRTTTQIITDNIGIDLTDEALMASYDFENGYQTDVSDASSNGNDLLGQCAFYLDETPALDDYAYSFAVVGDTQIITDRYPDKLATIYDWILNNAEGFNIQHIFGMGDITNQNTEREWNTATTEFRKLEDSGMSYSLVRGNHDGFGYGTNPDSFNYYITKDTNYAAMCDGAFEEGSLLNTYQYLTVGTTDYLIFNLDYGFSDEVIAWASEIIENHPNHNVIITTHAYLYRDGTTLDQGDVCPPAISGGYNNGDHMWDKFISKHENIVLVMNGHDPCARTVTTQTRGENGNLVTQMLIDPQGLDADSSVGPTGMVTMLYFSEDGKDVQVRTYSTIKEKYYGKANQYDITIDKVDPVMGDANDDGNVNITDLVTITMSIAGKDISYNKNTADINGDGKIDKLDLTEIRSLIIK